MTENLKVNLHILQNCNYNCKHCFAHFDDDKLLLFEDWKIIIDNCLNSNKVNYFNIAGGEPLIYKDLMKIVKYIHSKGILCSIITNGFLMDEKWIKENAKYFDTIGFSIDSFNKETLISMGRCNCNNQFLSKEQFQQLCFWIKQYNPKCKIKINTVVTTINKNENLYEIIKELGISLSRWKILKMDIFINENFNNSFFFNYRKRIL